MKRKRSRPASADPFGRSLFWWSLLAIVVWVGSLIWHVQHGAVFSFLVFVKGLVLLAGAATVYRLSAVKGFSLLGFFPLSWLSAAQFQWDLCTMDIRYWLWLALFLCLEIIILAMPDGKRLLVPLVPLWAALAALLPPAILLPLSFVTAPPNRFKRANWIKWGGVLAAACLFLVLRGWEKIFFYWRDLFDFLGPGRPGNYISLGRYIAFFLLGWLGLAAFSKKGAGRHVVFPLFFLVLGFFFLEGPMKINHLFVLKWVMVFLAGFGFESFRRDLMDDTWHGRAVWAAAGVGLAFGV
jgi:hypothetical protein